MNTGRPVSSSRADAEKKTKLTKGARWSVHLKHEGVSGASSWRDWTGARARTGRRAALGELTGAAATGREGAGRRREVFSATSSRYGAGGSTGLLGTRGDLRSGRGRRARPRARERGKCCLGGRGWRCESFLPTMAAFYRREREHEVSGLAARARPVWATEGTRRSVLSAEGCGVLWRAAGALAGCGVVWCRGGKEGVLRWFSSQWSGQSKQGDRGGWTRDGWALWEGHGYVRGVSPLLAT
jgi:hypothetical protein